MWSFFAFRMDQKAKNEGGFRAPKLSNRESVTFVAFFRMASAND